MSKKIACIGDSLTEGYGIDNKSSWISLLNIESQHEYINCGISGDTTAGMLARFHPMVIPHKPDYVIIMGGTNDIWFDIPDNQIIANILAMTRYARKHNIQSIIGIPTPFYLPEVYEDDRLFINLHEMKQRLEEYILMLKKFIQSDEQPSIDFSLKMTSHLFLEDGLHPNEEGHRVMFENAKNSLNNIL